MFECFVLGDDTCKTLLYPTDYEEIASGFFTPVLSAVASVSEYFSLTALCCALCATLVVTYKTIQTRAQDTPLRMRAASHQ